MCLCWKHESKDKEAGNALKKPFISTILYIYVGQICNQCDQIGQFSLVIVQQISYKIAQIFTDIFVFFEDIPC